VRVRVRLDGLGEDGWVGLGGSQDIFIDILVHPPSISQCNIAYFSLFYFTHNITSNLSKNSLLFIC
jgi:hypothetical protein